jgi:hypothetical protein
MTERETDGDQTLHGTLHSLRSGYEEIRQFSRAQRASSANELARRNPPTPDPSLTLTRTQYPAIVGSTGNRKHLTYAGFANLCNIQQPLTAHS